MLDAICYTIAFLISLTFLYIVPIKLVFRNMILDWNTDVATTRKKVEVSERKNLLQISYRNADGESITEQYIGTEPTDDRTDTEPAYTRYLSRIKRVCSK